jgi:hypothetical protein
MKNYDRQNSEETHQHLDPFSCECVAAGGVGRDRVGDGSKKSDPNHDTWFLFLEFSSYSCSSLLGAEFRCGSAEPERNPPPEKEQRGS